MTAGEKISLGHSARAIAAGVRAGEWRASAILERTLERIEAEDRRLAAFVEVFAERARREAEAVDAARAAGKPLGPLAGVPVAIKDMFAREGCLLTCGSKILAGYRSPYTATAVARLEQAGAIVVGRTNMDEFGMGSSTEHSCYGATKNPRDPSRTPGGSSGGSAAAVAAGFVPIALGSDTGGSVRQPAAFCGVLGLKPTYGRIPRHGLVAFASSLDHVGIFAREAGDLALALSVVAGPDGQDATALPAPAPPPDLAPLEPKGLRIGVIEEAFAQGVDQSVARGVRKALDALGRAGAKVTSCHLPSLPRAIPAYYVLCTSEASSNLARYDGVRYGLRVPGEDLETMYARTRAAGFGPEVKRRILLGTFALRKGYAERYYGRATALRAQLRRELDAAFAKCDVLAMPTTPTAAWKLGAKLADPLAMYVADVLTVPANLAGVPAISVPCGESAEGLPIGLQLVAAAGQETLLLRAAGLLTPQGSR